MHFYARENTISHKIKLYDPIEDMSRIKSRIPVLGIKTRQKNRQGMYNAEMGKF